MVGRPRRDMMRERLRADRLRSTERAELERALALPWCWPGDPVLAEQAARWVHAPRALEAGEAAFVTVAGDRSRASLVHGRWSSAALAHPIPLAESSRTALAAIEALVKRALGVLPPPNAHAGWSCALGLRVGEGIDQAIEGPSLGLAAGLALASLWLGRAFPPEVIAMAELSGDGRVLPVGGLAAKITFVASEVLGATTVLVAKAQHEEARAAVAASARPSLRVVGVSDLDAALATALDFAADDAAWERWLSEDRRASSVAQHAFERLLDGTPAAYRWEWAERALRCAARTAPEPFAERATLGADLAARHAGRSVLLAWPSEAALHSLAKPRRMRLLAHVVQSGADHDDASSRERIEQAKRFVADGMDRTESDWVLLGALGRAAAASGDYAQGAAFLDAALEGWLSVGSLGEASYAFCERSRIAGVRGETQWEPLRAIFQTLAHHEGTSVTSLAYCALALGRALVTAGEGELACEVLQHPIPWPTLAPFLSEGRLRWTAAAHARVGRVERAREVRAELRALAPLCESTCYLALDEAVETGGDATGALEALLAHELAGPELRRVMHRAPMEGREEWLWRHVRY